MTQEQKGLLLKDIYGRLLYGVKCKVIKRRIDGEMVYIRSGTSALELTVNNVKGIVTNSMYEIKPYLFPLSSVTDEQKYTCPIGVANLETFIKNESWTYLELTPDSIICFIDWLNKNHFDIYGLIPMGLAIDATGLNIY